MPCLVQVDKTRAMEKRERKDKEKIIMTMILGFRDSK
jgi:hypothetical protein